MSIPNPATTEWVPIWNPTSVGPVGPQGPQGPAGSITGLAGSLSVVFSSTEDIVTSGMFVIVRVPFAITLTRWTIMADAVGDIAFEIVATAPGTHYPPNTLITGSAPPVLTGANFATNTALTGWTVNLPAGHCMRVAILSTSDVITNVTLQLDYSR